MLHDVCLLSIKVHTLSMRVLRDSFGQLSPNIGRHFENLTIYLGPITYPAKYKRTQLLPIEEKSWKGCKDWMQLKCLYRKTSTLSCDQCTMTRNNSNQGRKTILSIIIIVIRLIHRLIIKLTRLMSLWFATMHFDRTSPLTVFGSSKLIKTSGLSAAYMGNFGFW